MAQMTGQPAAGRIHSVFRRACAIQFENDHLVVLVAPEVGNGPLNIVLEGTLAGWQSLQSGMVVRREDKRVQVGHLSVSLEAASIWEPCPDWERFRPGAGRLLRRAGPLADWAQERVPGDSLLALLGGPLRGGRVAESATHARALAGAGAMWAGWQGDEAQLRAGTTQLAGLGGGLTPAGDDFTLGALLCAWLAHPDPVGYCSLVVGAAAGRTTMLSAAFLKAAGRGECVEVWHGLLEALEDGSGGRVIAAAAAVLAYGHTSGADALAGFLWMGQRVLGG